MLKNLRRIDEQVLDDWFSGEMYSNALEYLSNKNIESCVDIGAGVGVATYCILQKLNPSIVYCFEPDEENFFMLEDNLKDFSNVKLYNFGIFYGITESKVLGVGDNNPLGYVCANIEPQHLNFWGDSLKEYIEKIFRFWDLESFVEDADLIKIDTEGSEYNIIENSPLVKECKYLLLETHNHPIDYIEEYLKEKLPKHSIIYSQGYGIHLGFLLEKK